MSDETEHVDAKLTAAARHALPNHSFGIPGREGLPLEDAAHVRDAMARFGQEHFKDDAEKRGAYHRVVARAHELGIDPAGFVKKYGGQMDAEAPGTTTSDQVPGTAVACACTERAVHLPGMDTEKLTTDLAAALASLADATARADAAEQKATKAEADKAAAEILVREATKDAKAATTRADAAEAAIAAEKTRADAAVTTATATRTDAAQAEFDARVLARVEVLAAANSVLGANDKDEKPVDRTKISDRDLKVAIARHVDGDDAVLDDDSNDAVNASYRGALKRAASGAKSRSDVLQTIADIRGGAAVTEIQTPTDNELAAKKKMNDRAAAAWTRNQK